MINYFIKKILTVQDLNNKKIIAFNKISYQIEGIQQIKFQIDNLNLIVKNIKMILQDLLLGEIIKLIKIINNKYYHKINLKEI